ncbi:MAG: WhiB family transcriptional regulator [Kineosporiaceae bacterium]
MPWNEDWPTQAVCREDHPDALFVQGAAQQQAKIVCFRCPVRAECLSHALDTRTEFGVWGGMTERERRQLLRNHPGVASWREVFQNAMEEQESAAPTVPAPHGVDTPRHAGTPRHAVVPRQAVTARESQLSA